MTLRSRGRLQIRASGPASSVAADEVGPGVVQDVQCSSLHRYRAVAEEQPEHWLAGSRH